MLVPDSVRSEEGHLAALAVRWDCSTLTGVDVKPSDAVAGCLKLSCDTATPCVPLTKCLFMTLADLENTFPYGLHDTFLMGFTVSFPHGTAVLDVLINVTRNEPEFDPEYKRANIYLNGLVAFVVEIPWVVGPMDGPLDICSFDTTEYQYPGFSKIPPEEQKKFRSLYVGKPWDNYIHIAAASAEVVWDDSGIYVWGS